MYKRERPYNPIGMIYLNNIYIDLLPFMLMFDNCLPIVGETALRNYKTSNLVYLLEKYIKYRCYTKSLIDNINKMVYKDMVII